MPANAQLYQTTTITAATIVTTAETIVATLDGVAADPYGSNIRINGMVNITVGTAGATVELRVRRNTVAGTQLGGTNSYAVLAAGIYPLEVTAIGSAPVGVHQFVVTAKVLSAAGNSTVNAVAVTATVGN